MHKNEPITVNRDCDAVLIPIGNKIVIPKDSTVFVTQALGGNYTVNINGNLARIEAKNADAIGIELEQENDPNTKEIIGNGLVDEALVWEQLRTCYDPEIPINIVDLGLIYDCKISKLENNKNRVDIVMTLTAVGCGMGDFIAEDARLKVLSVPNVNEANVTITFEPPWSKEMMSEAARLETGIY